MQASHRHQWFASSNVLQMVELLRVFPIKPMATFSTTSACHQDIGDPHVILSKW